MQPHINVTILGVSDLEQSLAFYRDGLDLATEGICCVADRTRPDLGHRTPADYQHSWEGTNTYMR